MNWLLDTCVISELIRPQPSPHVAGWVRAQKEHRLFLSVLTLGEIRKGIDRLLDSEKRRELDRWLREDLENRFSGRVLPVDQGAALRWGEVAGRLERTGRKTAVIDGLLAATALFRGLTLVTRNTGDMIHFGAEIFNPWESGG